MILLALAIFGGTGRVQRGIGSRARNLLQGIGDGTDQIFHAVTGNSGNGMKFKVALLARIAKNFEPRRHADSAQRLPSAQAPPRLIFHQCGCPMSGFSDMGSARLQPQ